MFLYNFFIKKLVTLEIWSNLGEFISKFLNVPRISITVSHIGYECYVVLSFVSSGKCTEVAEKSLLARLTGLCGWKKAVEVDNPILHFGHKHNGES